MEHRIVRLVNLSGIEGNESSRFEVEACGAAIGKSLSQGEHRNGDWVGVDAVDESPVLVNLSDASIDQVEPIVEELVPVVARPELLREDRLSGDRAR